MNLNVEMPASLSISPMQHPSILWVEETFRAMNLRDKIAQLFHTTLTHWDGRIPQEHLFDRAVKNKVGGGFMAGKPWRELHSLAGRVLAECEVPMIFSGDSECGPNTPHEGVALGSAMAIGAIADIDEAAELAYEAGKIAALQCRACGVRWSFAPVADLNLNPDNPITNIRSFGSDPRRVARLVSAYLRGMQEHGLAATLKHFPGDGMDSRDQHVMTALNGLSEEEWFATYGHVFSTGINAGVWSMMAGHLAWTARSSRHPETGRFLPATADKAIQIDLLRHELGFDGLIVSDAIGMGGLAGHFRSEAEVVFANIQSGSDVVLFVEEVESAIEYFFRALDDGRITEQRIEESVRRILTLKTKVGIDKDHGSLPALEQAEAAFAERYVDVTQTIARKSVTLASDQGGLFPLKLDEGSRVLIFDLPRETSELAKLAVVDSTVPVEESSSEPAPCAFERRFLGAGYNVTRVSCLKDYLNAVEYTDLVIYLFRNGPQAGRNSVRLSYDAVQSLDMPRIFSGFPVACVALGSPCVLWEIPVLPNLVCTYAAHPAALEACADAMLGSIPFAGRLPLSIAEDACLFRAL